MMFRVVIARASATQTRDTDVIRRLEQHYAASVSYRIKKIQLLMFSSLSDAYYVLTWPGRIVLIFFDIVRARLFP